MLPNNGSKPKENGQDNGISGKETTSSEPPIHSRTIDPTHLKPGEDLWLANLFYHLAGPLFRKNTPHRFDMTGEDGKAVIRCEVTLKHSILKRPRESHPNQFRFEIIGPTLTKSRELSIFTSQGLFYFDKGTVRYKPSDRIIRVSRHDKDLSVEGTNNYYRIGKILRYLHVKQPVFTKINDTWHGFMAAKRFKGKDLLDVLCDDRNGTRVLTTDERLKICLSVADALANVHDRGVVHGDVKPENIIFDLKTFEAAIIDVEYSKKASEKDKRVGGTPQYIALETLQGEATDERCDYPGYGKVCHLVSGGAEADIRDEHGNIVYDKVAKEARNPTHLGLLSMMRDLTEKHAAQFEKLVRSTTDGDRDTREELEDARKTIADIIFERKLQTIEASLQNPLIHAHYQADILRTQLREISLTKPISSIQLQEIAALFKKQLSIISDHPVIIADVIETLKIHALDGATNPAEILLRIENAASAYDTCIKTLLQLAQQHSLPDVLAEILVMHKGYFATLDETIEFTRKLNKELAVLTAAAAAAALPTTPIPATANSPAEASPSNETPARQSALGKRRWSI